MSGKYFTGDIFTLNPLLEKFHDQIIGYQIISWNGAKVNYLVLHEGGVEGTDNFDDFDQAISKYYVRAENHPNQCMICQKCQKFCTQRC